MKRVTINPRTEWKAKVEALGFHFHSANEGDDPTYWDERVAYEFSSEEVDMIEAATQELYHRCLDAVEWVIKNHAYEALCIPPQWASNIEASWRNHEWDLYGRFDLLLDATGTPKMLEFNADTPTSLYEAAIIQWEWLEDYRKSAAYTHWDQFNSLHEKLVASWATILAQNNGKRTVYLSALDNILEDNTTAWYLQDCAQQAGWDARYIAIEQIGWNNVEFTDLQEQPIDLLFKLYPWEWLVHEEYGEFLRTSAMRTIEPPWKMILSNKGILPILWKLFPHHANLLPAYTTAEPLGNTYVRKPLLSREGANVKLVLGKHTIDSEDAGYGEEGYIYQGYQLPSVFDGMTPVIGSWIVGGVAGGMGIREDSSAITTNQSRFVPHYFV